MQWNNSDLVTSPKRVGSYLAHFLVQGQGDKYNDGFTDGVLRQSRKTQDQTQGECPGVPSALTCGGSTEPDTRWMPRSSPSTKSYGLHSNDPIEAYSLHKTSPLNAIVGLSFYPLNISQWGFKVHTWTWEDRLKLHSNSSGNATLYIFCTRKESQQHFEKCMTLTDIFLIKKMQKRYVDAPWHKFQKKSNLTDVQRRWNGNYLVWPWLVENIFLLWYLVISGI